MVNILKFSFKYFFFIFQVKLAFPDSDGSTTNSCPEDDHQLFPEETVEKIRKIFS